jgi:flavin-dependent dehydrogenase
VNRKRIAIVGGGPSGISTALFLVHALGDARDVVVLERETYPREKYCAGGLGARADKLLATIGVTVDVPSVPIDGLAYRALGETRIVRKPGSGRVVRRLEYDAALARVAKDRGVDVREGVRVTGVREHAGGVTIQTDGGEVLADFVVGADGVESVVRRALGIAQAPHRAQALEVDTEPVASDLPRGVILFDLSDRDLPGYYWEFPTAVDGRELVCRGVYYLKTYGAAGKAVEIDAVLSRELAARGLSLGNYRKKRYAERGFAPGGRIATRRALLAGEAAGIDPVTGEGIAQAIQYGATAGIFLAAKLRAGDPSCDGFEAAVRGSSVGRDLRVRTAAVDLAFGRYRPAVERFLLDTPEFVGLGLSHFGGHGFGKPAVLRTALAALASTARAVVSL